MASSSDTLSLGRDWSRWVAQSKLTTSLPILLFIGLAAIVLLLSQTLLLSSSRSTLDLAIGSAESRLLTTNMYAVEEDIRGTFRWSDGNGQFTFRQIGRGETTILHVRTGPPPPDLVGSDLTISFNNQPYTTIPLDERARLYQIVVPPSAIRFGDFNVGMQSPTITVPPDTRQVGIRLEEATLDIISTGWIWPSIPLVAVQTTLLTLFAMLMRRLHLKFWMVGGSLLLVASVLVIGFNYQTLLFFPYVARLTMALVILLGLTLWVPRLLERHASWLGAPRILHALWGLTVLACLVRWVGSLYPLFSAYDLPLNTDRFLSTINGTLVMTNRSFEFRGGVTVYPPGPYLVLLPGMFSSILPALIVQGGISLIDGLSTLTIAGLARKLGASTRATLFSALIYAVIPISLTSLWWGHTAQIFGQALMAPLAIVLLMALQTAQRRYWWFAGVILSVAFLTHIGVTILAVAWLGLAWVALGLQHTVPRSTWWQFTIMLGISGIIGFVFAYAPVATMKVEESLAVGEQVLEGSYVPAYNLIARAFWISFHPLGILLLLPGVLLLWRGLPCGGAELVGGWLGTVIVFWAVEMYSGLQVRYLVFLTPLACLFAAVLLDQVLRRGHASRYVAWGVLLLISVQSCLVWYIGTFTGVAPSMIPLLR
ncbi:MAG: hypothetical protein GFH27_549285n127 [Chloroflexi bacterium AL-W]|nr:hypothetical protein [Chloroflexi bacterium AL-N1]NOK65639.1 hypothetical protein [Chloroflexi bacterium AL-N10]NOK74420.1 hypothetical protein [Chloroflexi bacterium AL-N5]NOK80672.1 hypothetical protein [Chloroflexi bacterium AL-W]NOK88678.1 hypothetical protein [Chloroflexi bacterium AL-N15]